MIVAMNMLIVMIADSRIDGGDAVAVLLMIGVRIMSMLIGRTIPYLE